MNIIAIDPGPVSSGIVMWNGSEFTAPAILPNFDAERFPLGEVGIPCGIDLVAIEGVACYAEVFETCYQIGRIQRIAESRGIPWKLIYRKEVKIHLCQSMKAKDPNIRRALLDRFGEPGTKREPGILYGIKSHIWSAVAIAVTAYDLRVKHA